MKKYKGKTATAIIQYPDEMILLIKRDTRPFRGYWALPGGRMDNGETITQTVLREVREETGLEVEIIDVLGAYVEIGVKDDVEYEYYPTCFIVKPIGGTLRKQDSEIQELKLFGLDKLPSPLAFEHDKMIMDYVKHLKSGAKT